MRVYHRNLPHWRQSGATYFVTFRQADSLPQSKLRELDRLREDSKRRRTSGRDGSNADRLARETMQHVERWLDEGMGDCVLQDRRVHDEVSRAIPHFDDGRYEVGAFVVMPNHVHAVVRPFVEQGDLEKVLQGWKRRSSMEINQRLGRESATLWQAESFDRIVRDEEHLWRCVQYIGRNPRLAGLDDVKPWIRDEWRRLGWGFAEPRAGADG